jgi:spore coat protein U-like protein
MLTRKILATIVTTTAVAFAYSSSTLAAQATDTATADIVTALAINWNTTNSLNFGSISPGGTGAANGTVTVTPAGARSAVNVGLAGGTVDYGGFNVQGCNNCTYAISLDPTPFTLTGVNPANTLDITAWSTATGSGTATLDGTGADTVSVGGTIGVNATQPVDTYTATYTVTVNYN